MAQHLEGAKIALAVSGLLNAVMQATCGTFYSGIGHYKTTTCGAPCNDSDTGTAFDGGECVDRDF